MIHAKNEFIRQQERSLQSDAFNLQQEVAIVGIAGSLVLSPTTLGEIEAFGARPA